MLHFRLVTFRFAYGRDRKPIIFIISGFLDVSMTHQTNYFQLGYTKRFKIIQEHPNHFRRQWFQISETWTCFVFFGNTRAEQT